MGDEEFERLEKINYQINNGYEVQQEDLKWMVEQLRIQDTMINIMASNLTTPIHGEDWVKKYYKEEAKERLCLK